MSEAMTLDLVDDRLMKLRRLVDVVRGAPTEKFDMMHYRHPCGSPSCMIGNAARDPVLSKGFEHIRFLAEAWAGEYASIRAARMHRRLVGEEAGSFLFDMPFERIDDLQYPQPSEVEMAAGLAPLIEKDHALQRVAVVIAAYEKTREAMLAEKREAVTV